MVQQMKPNPNQKRLLLWLVFRGILHAGHQKNSQYICQPIFMDEYNKLEVIVQSFSIF